MAITAAQLQVKVSADTADAESGLDRVSKKSNDAGSGLSGMFAIAGGFVVAQAAAAAMGFLSSQIGDVFNAAQSLQDVQTQTNTVLQSTHDVSGMTASAVNDLAISLSKVTPFARDTVQAATNMLLTFTTIGKDVMPQATQTVLDMSQALGQDTKSSAIQLGKALDDPIKGITALSRVGVTFDAQQKALIKTYVQHGEIAKAQGVILTELQKEFGNSATAAGTTFAGKLAILNNSLDETKAKIGDAILPVLVGLATALMPIAQQMIDAVLPVVLGFVASLTPVINQLSGALPDAMHMVLGVFSQAAPILGIATALFTQIGGVAKLLWPYIEQLGETVATSLLPVLKTLAFGVLGIVVTVFGNLVGLVRGSNLAALFGGIGAAVGIVADILQNLATLALSILLPAIQTVFGWIRSDVMPIVTAIAAAIQSNLKPTVASLNATFLALQPQIHQLMTALKNLEPIFHLIADVVGVVVVTAIGVLFGAIRGIAGALGGVITAITGVADFLRGTFDFIVGIFTLNGTKIKAGLGEMAGGIKNIFTGLFSAVLGFIGGFFSGLLGWFDKITGGALGRFAKGFSDGWNRLWNGVKGFFSGIWNDIVGFFVGIATTISTHVTQFVTGIHDTITNGFNLVKTIIHDALAFVVGLFSWLYDHNYYFHNLVDNIKAVFNDVKAFILFIWTAITSYLVNTWTHIKNDVTTAFNDVKAFLSGIWTTISTDVSTVVGTITGLLKRGWAVVSGDVSAAWNSFTGAISNAVSAIGTAIGNVVSAVTSPITNMANLAINWGENLINGFIKGIQNAVAGVKNAVGNVAQQIASNLGFHSPAKEGPGREADVWMPNLMKMLTDGIHAGAPAVQAAARGVAQQLQSALGGSLTVGIGAQGVAGGAGFAPRIAIAGPTPNQLAQSTLGAGSAGGAGSQQIILEIDGRRLASVLLPYTVGNIRQATGIRGY